MDLSDAAYLCGVLSQESTKLQKLQTTFITSLASCPLGALEREELQAHYQAAIVALAHCYERAITGFAAHIVGK